MATTRFPNGLTTTTKNETLGAFILPAPNTAHLFWEDFDYYNADDWTVTEVGVAAQTLIDGDGGRLGIVNAGADNDASFLQKVGESFLFETGKKLWFECRFEVADATQTDVVMGLQITDTSPLSVTDGVYFIKNDDAATIDFVVVKGSVATTTSNIGTLGNAQFTRLGYFYNGVDKITIFIDGAAVATSVTDNLPDDEVLTISFGLQNGEAAIKAMNVDYIMAAKER